MPRAVAPPATMTNDELAEELATTPSTQCPGCERMVDAICGTCEECSDGCCGCEQCPSCDRIYTSNRADMCYECGYCRQRCCSCDPVDEDEDSNDDYFSTGRIFRMSNPLTFWEPKRSQLTINPSKRMISAEIEVGRTEEWQSNHCDAMKKWRVSVVGDGSLPETGFEINTSPAGGDLFVQQIEEICKELRSAGAEATDSCGLHIHVDGRDMRYWDVRRLIFLYEVLEPVIFGTIPRSRRRSSYCHPCGKRFGDSIRMGFVPKKCKDAVAKAVYGHKDTRQHKNNKYASQRYSALNIHSWFHRGTIEFRMHSGTTYANKIVPWGMFLADLMDMAESTTNKDAERLAKVDPFALAEKVAKTDMAIGYLKKRFNIHSGGKWGQLDALPKLVDPMYESHLRQREQDEAREAALLREQSSGERTSLLTPRLTRGAPTILTYL